MSVILMVACSTAEQDRLRESVEAAAQTCPIHVADGVTIDTIVYADNVVTYYATVNNPLMPLKVLGGEIDTIKPQLLQMIHSSDDSKVKSDVDMCLAAGASIRYVLSDGQDTVTIDISNDELKR